MTDPTINHANEALRLLGLPVTYTEDQEASLVAVAAQAHATLALEAQTARLADEARTANLIAYLAAIANVNPGEYLSDEGRVSVGILEDLIQPRLDLTQDVTP